MHKNTITAEGEARPIHWPPMLSNGRRLFFNVTENEINVNGRAEFSIAARGLSVARESRVYIEGNRINSATSDARIMVTDVSLAGSSRVFIDKNQLVSTGGNL